MTHLIRNGQIVEAPKAELYSAEQMMQMIVALQTQLAEAKAAKPRTQRKVTWEIGQAGGLVIKGTHGGKYPIHMFLNQWDALRPHLDEIAKFVEANRSKFSTKD